MTVTAVSIPPNVQRALARAADATGVDFAALAETAKRESGFRSTAQASTSSARGLFQFIDSTWLDMVAKHGAKHGFADIAARARDPAFRREVLSLRDDPTLSALMAGELARANADTLAAALGRPATTGEVYAAHVLGAGGAIQLIRAAGRGEPDASALFPKAAAANRGLFFENEAPVSAERLLARLAGDRPESAPTTAKQRFETPIDDEIAALVNAFIQESLVDLLDPGLGDAGRGWLARVAYDRLLKGASTVP